MRIKLTLQYKGTNYHGWQIQPNGITVQEVLQKVLCRVLRQRINVVGGGRTDSGVHALGYVCHVDVPSSDCHDTPSFLHSLNSLLPPDITITNIEPASDDFHAQKSAKRKIYDYSIHNARIRSPFLQDYVWQIPYPLDIKKMKNAAKILVGRHDFKSFCGSGSSVKTTVRHIYRVAITNKVSLPHLGGGTGRGGVANFLSPSPQPSPQRERGLIRITIIGNGFLKHMVRNIVGTLVQVGRGKMTLTQFKKVLRGRDRRLAGPTAPARGLVLREIVY